MHPKYPNIFSPIRLGPVELPSIISLFRRPLLNEWARTGASLEDVVTHVIVHEVGHHFGLSDEQMQAIEDDPA